MDEINYKEPWALSRPREACADCGTKELHDAHRRLIIEVLLCVGCGRRICKRCFWVHMDTNHSRRRT